MVVAAFDPSLSPQGTVRIPIPLFEARGTPAMVALAESAGFLLTWSGTAPTNDCSAIYGVHLACQR